MLAPAKVKIIIALVALLILSGTIKAILKNRKD
jgi:hypothetical protein